MATKQLNQKNTPQHKLMALQKPVKGVNNKKPGPIVDRPKQPKKK